MLSHRLKVAVPLIAVAVLALTLPGLSGQLLFALLALGFLGGSIYESFELSKAGCPGVMRYRGSVMGFGAALLAAAWLSASRCDNWIAANLFMDTAIALAMMLCSFGILFQHKPDQEALNAFGRACFNALFYCWMLVFLVKIYFLPGGHGPLFLGFLVCITKLGDIGAYFAGSTAGARLKGGSHKLAPLISPKKSWEGLAGGFLFSMAGAVVFRCFAGERLAAECMGRSFSLGYLDVLSLGALAASVGLLGDLLESVVKRAASAKDSGNIPGLGGVLDIVDSLVPMGMLCYLWVLLKLI